MRVNLIFTAILFTDHLLFVFLIDFTSRKTKIYNTTFS